MSTATISTTARQEVLELAAQQQETYRRQPMELRSHFNREVDALDGYRDRQILELLQNADDAGVDSQSCKLLFHLTKERLVVANTGKPFSKKGIMSLVIPDCSPKQLEQNRFIGQMGLGFRSVLTWTDRPLVASGDYEVVFDRQRAISIVQQLAKDQREVAEVVDEFRASADRWPAAVMRFPLLPEENDVWLKTANEYRAEGYDTVLVLPLLSGAEREQVHQDIAKQLESLSMSSLLFCRHLTEVSIAGDLTGLWGLDRTKGENMVTLEHDGAPATWHIYRGNGKVSKEAAEQSIRGRRREYEIAVAVPEQATPNPAGTLCVYFPTQVHLPCPLVMHATLETTPDRKRLVSKASNREVLKALGAHVARVLAQEASSWMPRRSLELLAGVERADPDLQEFIDDLIVACAGKALFPRLDRSMGTAAQVKQVPHSSWLKFVAAQEFAEVLPINREDGLNLLLARFNLQWFESAELKKRLGACLTRVSPATAGVVLGGLLAESQLSGVGADGLLIDNDGALIVGECFFPPSETLPALPSWASGVRFVNEEFQNSLLQAAKAGVLRTLVGQLDYCGAKVEEYRFETVARALIKRVEEGLDEDSPQAIPRWRELLLWIFNANTGQSLSSMTLKVVTTKGSLRRATTAYLGPDYPGGVLLARLYGSFGDDEFVGSPAANGLGSVSLSDAEAFLCRIGVNNAPRMVKLEAGADYKLLREQVVDRLGFPLTLRGVPFEDATDFRRHAWYAISNLFLPDRFLELLAQGDAALVAYMLSTGAPLLTNEVDAQAKLQTTVGAEQKPRNEDAVPIPNPVLFFLREKSWVPTNDGMRKPAKIMISASGARVLRGVFARHSIDYKDRLIAACGGREAVESLLTRLGAVSSLENLGGQSLYELLLGLPANDPKGKVASGIYRTLMESSASIEESSYRSQFLRDGKMWGHYQGKEEYLPIGQLRYNANVTIPKAIESHIPLVDIPRAKNTHLVKDLFGIEPLGSEEISVTVLPENTEFDDGSSDAQQHLITAIPYIYALRLGSGLDAGGRDLNLLRKATLRVCTRAHIAARLPDGTTRDIILSESGGRIAADTTLVMIGEYRRNGQGTLTFWLGVAELVAEFLGRDIAGEVGGILRCDTPAEMAEVVRVRLGRVAEAKLAEAKNRLASEIEEEEETRKVIPPPKPDAANHEAHPEPAAANPATEPAAEQNPAEPEKRTETAIEPITGPSTKPGKRRALVVVGGSSGGSFQWRGPIATEEVTFRVVEAFEQHEGPRYIIPVSHLHGSNAFGCDLLSVSSQAIKDQALQQGEIKETDILRYIEVKGRTSRTGEIELEPNEFRSAEEHRERYWIYRVYCDRTQDDHYEIALLSDPINSNAVRKVTRFNMGQGSGAAWFSMIEKTVDDVPASATGNDATENKSQGE